MARRKAAVAATEPSPAPSQAIVPTVITPMGVISFAMVETVHDYERLSQLKADVKKLEAKARPAALKFAAQGIMVLEGPEGVVTIKEKAGARRFDMEKARAVLGNILEDDRLYTVGDPTHDVVFQARVKPVPQA